MHAPNRLLQILVYLLVITLSVVLLFWGISTTDPKFQLFMIAFSGSLLGVGLTGFATSFEIFNHWEKLTQTLSALTGSRWVSDHPHLSRARRALHHYYVTLHGGASVWHYDLIDFSRNTVPGVLSIHSYYQGDSGLVASSISAVVVDQRLIMTIKDANSDECSDVCVYPLWMTANLSARCGIEFRESLDRIQIVCPGILSNQVLFEWDTTGCIEPTTAVKLEELWLKESDMVNRDLLRPRPNALQPAP